MSNSTAAASSAVRTAKEGVVHDYVRCVNAKAISGIEKLYARDSLLEDPAGSEPIVGRGAILSFYTDISFRNLQSLELTGPVRVTPTQAAFPARATLMAGGGSEIVDVIDVFEFDENNRIISMKAYWG